MNLPSSLTKHQVLNLSLSAFLLVGIFATTYTVTNLSSFNAEAARGGGGKPVKTATCTTCTLTVMEPVYAGPGHAIVSGSGFKAGENLYVGVNGDIPFSQVTADSGGRISFVYDYPYTWFYAGYTYLMLAGNTNGGVWNTRASDTFIPQ